MIYLDIDGVLILTGDANDSPAVLRRAAIVADICAITGARLVISSQRRISDDVLTLLSDLGLTRYLADDHAVRTPFVRGDDLDPDLPVRGQEIDGHMMRHRPDRHAILDDDHVLAHHNHVPIDPDRGISDHDGVRAIAFLTGSGFLRFS